MDMAEFGSILRRAFAWRNKAGSAGHRPLTSSTPQPKQSITLLELPVEIRFAIYDFCLLEDLLSWLALSRVCRKLKAEVDNSDYVNPKGAIKQILHRSRLYAYAQLCESGGDKRIGRSRALCSVCLDSHKKDLFSKDQRAQPPQIRRCLEGGAIQICPCYSLSIDSILAQAEVARVSNATWNPMRVRAFAEHDCGLWSRRNKNVVGVTRIWPWKTTAELRIDYENVHHGEAAATQDPLEHFLHQARAAHLHLCPHLKLDDRKTVESLRKRYVFSKQEDPNAMPRYSCPVKHCHTTVVFWGSVYLTCRVVRDLGDIWTLRPLDNARLLAQTESVGVSLAIG